MANAKKGEVGVKFGGKTVNLVLDFNAICALEEVCDTDIVTIAEGLDEAGKTGKMHFKTMRAVLWAAMQKAMPDADILQAGELAQELGSGFGTVVGELFTRSGMFGGDEKGAPAGNVKSSKAPTG